MAKQLKHDQGSNLHEYESISHEQGIIPYINEQIAPFTIKGRLGEGGIGQIYIAEDLSGKATRAVKVLKEDKSDPTLIKRFRLEYDLLNSLHHPCIAKVYDYHVGEVTFFTMEHIIGQTLTDEFEIQTKFERPENKVIHRLIDVTFQCLEALHFLHSRHIIHRDLKPANIMINNEGKIKVLDFGVARRQDSDLELTQKQEIIGTFEYMAPEVLAGYAYDHRIDLYSLGVILYRVLSGKRMFEVYSFLDMFKAKSHRESPLLSKEGLANFEWFVDLINRLTMRAPQKRFKSASECVRWMENHYSTGHILARLHSPLDHLTSPLLAVRNAPLLARSGHLNELKSWLDMPARENLVIHGNSGTGKSRLISYIHSEGRLRQLPVMILDGQAITEDRSFFTQVFDVLHQSFFPETKNPLYSQELEWTWSSGIFNQFLRECGQDEIFMIIIDDFHLLPKGIQKEIGAFFQMGSQQEDIRINWVFSYSDELSGKLMLEEGISLLELIPNIKDVRLSPLSEEQSTALATYLLSENPIHPDLAKEIIAYSNGLPFSIAHFLSILIERNWLLHQDGLWCLSEKAFSDRTDQEEKKELGQGLLSNQIDKLDDTAVDLLRTLSVLGDKVRFEIIEKKYESTDMDLNKAISELVIQQFVSYDGPLVFFSDHHIRKHVYDALDDEQRKSYHHKAMELLEKYYGFEHPRHYLEYLYHANLADNKDKINQYSAGIGVFFFNRGMYSEAQQYFGNAIAHSGEKPTFLLVEFYFWKAECELCLFRLREASSDYLTALKHLELMESGTSEKHLVQKDKIRLVITHKLMLIEFERNRWKDAEQTKQKIVSILNRIKNHIRPLKIGQRLSISQRSWTEPDFPLRSQQTGAFQPLKAMFSTLVEMGPDGIIHPNLAIKWHWNASQNKLTFTLKKGVHYHNGALLRAEDVLFSLRVIKEQDFFHLNLTGPAKRIKSYQVLPTGEVEISYFPGPPPNMNFWCNLLVVPAYLFNHQLPGKNLDKKRAFIGSGPYELAQITSKGWGLKKTKGAKVNAKEIHVFADFPEALKQLEIGGFHVTELHYRDWKKIVPTIQVNNGIIRHQSVGNQVYRLCFKLRSTQTLPKEIRKALYHALPLENWNTLYLDNKYVVPRFRILKAQATEGQAQTRNPGRHLIDSVMSKFGATLNEDRIWCIDGKPLTIRILLPKDCRIKKVLRAIVKTWKDLGIQVQVAWREFHTFAKWIPNDKVDAWVDYTYIDPAYEGLADFLHEKAYPQGANFVGYKNEEMNGLVSTLQSTPSHRRKTLMLKIDELFAKDPAWFSLFQPKYFYAFSTQLGGLQPSVRGLLFSSKQFEALHPLL